MEEYQERRPSGAAPAFGSPMAATGGGNTRVVVLGILGLLCILISWGPNVGLAFLSLAALLIGAALLWRPTEPPILLFIFGYQWIEASLSTFYANFRGIPIDESTATGGNMQLATVLSLIGLLVLALGMRLAAGPPRAEDILRIREQAERIPQRTWFYLYLATYAVAIVAAAGARAVPGLSQPLLALAGFKWAAFIAFTYVTFTRADASKALWLGVFGVELILALGGYFSSFKFVFIFTFFSLMFAGVRVSALRVGGLLLCAILAITVGIYWTAVKGEYRSYLSGGVTQQIVTVPYRERVTYLADLVRQVDAERFRRATESLVTRIAYVDVFALAVNYVPHQIPHAAGRLLGDAISRPFMPRILFPSKPAIDESALTSQYTGVNVAGVAEGTQISLGYMGDSYVDFGPVGMMVPIFLLGIALGSVHRWLLRGGWTAGLVGGGLSVPTLFLSAGALGTSSAKLFGGLIVGVLVAWVVRSFVAPNFLRWLAPTRP